ncbi:MAG: ATP-dependent carboxylate-amine ligase [Notoacmeibacter sp.]|nr:ATP-dependent carboxylate-amine ligase [Notoacmeibacter sp.]MCC0033386.1 ATP-dependent carboxylate-amine ligase [Brucellaceae bacterium]
MSFGPLDAETAQRHFVYSMLHEACVAKGHTLHGDARYGYSGFIEFAPGKRGYFMGTAFDVNGQGASQLARDKAYAAQLLAQAGLNTPEGVLLFAPRYRAELALKNPSMAAKLGFAQPALDFAAVYGFPLFIKPNEGTAGRGVSRVTSPEQLFAAIHALFATSDKALLQAPALGRDYRLVVLDGAVLAAYERSPFTVTGDGAASIATLVSRALEGFARDNRPAGLEADDPRIATELAAQGLEPASVPAEGRRVVLMPNANLSTGGNSADVTGLVHPGFLEIAARAAAACGLTFAGVDIMAADISAPPADYTVIEVNSAPGLRNFAALTLQTRDRVRAIYAALVDRMAAQAGL